MSRLPPRVFPRPEKYRKTPREADPKLIKKSGPELGEPVRTNL